MLHIGDSNETRGGTDGSNCQMFGASLFRLTAVAVVMLMAGAAIGLGAMALAQDDTTYYACVNNSSGNIKMVGKPTDCARNEHLIAWNQQGPAGAAGSQGPVGSQGPAGQDGKDGADGTFTGTFSSPNQQFSISVTDDGIKLDGPSSTIEMDAGGAVKISGAAVTVEGSAQVTVKAGALVKVDGPAGVIITGAIVTVNGQFVP